MSIRLSAGIGATVTGRISLKFEYLGLLRKSVEKIQILVKIGQKYRAPYFQTEVQFIVAGCIKSP